MTWPERSTFRVIDRSSKEPVANLMLFVEVLTRHKNNYSVGPLITNYEGRAVLSRDQILEVIDESARSSPMDYSATISDCTGEIRITVDDEGALTQRIARVERFYPQDAARLKELAQTASNSEVEFRQLTAEASPEVTVEVRRRPPRLSAEEETGSDV